MSKSEVTMDCDKCKAYQYQQGKKAMHREMRNNSLAYRCGYEQSREETKKEILAFCKEAYHLKEVIEFLEQDLIGQ